MDEIKEVEDTKIFGNGVFVNFVSDLVDRKHGDTKVMIGGKSLCVIPGDRIEAFAKELRKLIEDYRI